MWLLSEFISWLNNQPAGTQGLVFFGLALGANVVGSVIKRGSVGLWNVTRRRYSAWREQQQPKVLPPSKIGLYDHAVNAADAIKRMPASIETVGEHHQKILAKLTKHANLIGDEPDVRKRQQLIARFSKDVRPDVAAFGKKAREVSLDGKLIIDSYRPVLHKSLLPDLAAKRSLLNEVQKFVMMGRSMPTVIVNLEQFAQRVSTLSDYAPEIGTKLEEAVLLLVDTFKALHEFSVTESQSIARRRVGLLHRWWISTIKA